MGERPEKETASTFSFRIQKLIDGYAGAIQKYNENRYCNFTCGDLHDFNYMEAQKYSLLTALLEEAGYQGLQISAGHNSSDPSARSEQLSARSRTDTAKQTAIFPCAVGDYAWYITTERKVEPVRITRLWVDLYSPKAHNLWLRAEYMDYSYSEKYIDCRIDVTVGKTLFFSEKDTLAALSPKEE